MSCPWLAHDRWRTVAALWDRDRSDGVSGLDHGELVGDIEILGKYKLAFLDLDEYRPVSLVTYRETQSGWELWADLRRFCDQVGESVDAVIADLRFDILDEPTELALNPRYEAVALLRCTAGSDARELTHSFEAGRVPCDVIARGVWLLTGAQPPSAEA